MLTLGLTVVFATAFAGDLLHVPKPQDIEMAALTQRRAIQRGTVTMRSTRYEWGSVHPTGGQINKLWFDGDKIRCDLSQIDRSGHTSPRSIDCRNCERDGYYVAFDEIKTPNARIALTLAKMGPDHDSQFPKIVDLRLIGMIPTRSDTLYHFNLEYFLLRPDRRALTIKRDVFKGQDCWLIEYLDLQGSKIHIWICPQKGNSVVRLISEGQGASGGYVSSIESTVVPVGSSGIWFPSTCVYERTLAGKPDQRETLEISDVSLNDPIPPEIFTIAGMHIEDGTPIIGTDFHSGSWYWKDGHIVRETDTARVPAPLSGTATRRRWAVILAAAAAILSVCLASLYLLRRRRYAPDDGPRGGGFQ